MNNEKCEVCGKAPEIAGQKLCRAHYEIETNNEPDFERLLELRNDYRAWQRDGDEA